MFKFNRQLGYAAINLPLFSLSFYLIWGWVGNMAYYRRRAILIDCSPKGFVGLLRLTLHSNGLETVVYMRRLLEWDWNSEHIAAWWGENHEATGYSPEYASYQGWLGSHYYV